MANTIELIIRANAAQAEAIIKKIGADVVTLNTAGEKSARSADAAANAYRRSVSQLASSIAGAAAVASLLAGKNEQLKRQFEVLSLTLSGLSTAISAVAAAARFLIGVLGIKLLIIGAVIAAVVLLVLNWDKAWKVLREAAQNFARWFLTLIEGIGQILVGFGKVISGAFMMNPAMIREGWEEMKKGASQAWGQIASAAKQGAAIAADAWKRLMDLLGTKNKKGSGVSAMEEMVKAAENARDKQMFLADSIKSVVPRMLEQINAQEQYINALMRASKAAKDENERFAIRNMLLKERLELEKKRRDLQEELDRPGRERREAFEAQRAGERELPTDLDAIIASVHQDQDKTRREAAEKLAELQGELLMKRVKEEEDALNDLISANKAQVQEVIDERARDVEDATAAAEHKRRLLDIELEGENDLIKAADMRRQAEVQAQTAIRDAIAAAIEKAKEQLALYLQQGAAGSEAVRAIAAEIENLNRKLGITNNNLEILAKQMPEAMRRMKEEAKGLTDSIESAFASMLTGILDGTKSLGEGVLGFFKSIGQSILGFITKVVAESIVKLIGIQEMMDKLVQSIRAGAGGKGGVAGLLSGAGGLGAMLPLLLGAAGLFFGHGGIAKGHLTPIAMAAQGMRTNRPTLAMLSEWGHEEAVVPLKDGKIPIEGGGGGGGVVNIYAWDTATGMDKLYEQREFIADLMGGSRRSNHPSFRGA